MRRRSFKALEPESKRAKAPLGEPTPGEEWHFATRCAMGSGVRRLWPCVPGQCTLTVVMDTWAGESTLCSPPELTRSAASTPLLVTP
jgi:hypothetical protein